jgi:hypothetical protein
MSFFSSHLVIFNLDFEPSKRKKHIIGVKKLSIQILQHQHCVHMITEVEIANGQILSVCNQCRKIKSKNSL